MTESNVKLRKLQEQLALLTRINRDLSAESLVLKKEGSSYEAEIASVEKQISEAQKTLYLVSCAASENNQPSYSASREEEKSRFSLDKGYTKELIEVKQSKQK
eukprot:TRINITY_DN6409_c0_g1_i9.p1 TRINITY_DN6409_c0_g1~~TRINITY_DN6409_c0_g1_i9.p1  ORF type:complete len:103 (+),score=26.46 TRINITY_DN6409_c0_g1_i9:174-482(+)